MVLQRGSTAVQFNDDRHATDEALERYAMGGLADPERAQFEDHLLVCDLCQDRLAEEDKIRERVRDGAAILPQTVPIVGRRSLKWAWASALAAGGLIAFAAIGWQSLHSFNGPPVVIFLQATRGSETALVAAPGGKPLTLVLDVTDLQQNSEYRVEIVDAHGHPKFESTGSPRNHQLHTTILRGLPGGEYFVRVYLGSRNLLREYRLSVRD